MGPPNDNGSYNDFCLHKHNVREATPETSPPQVENEYAEWSDVGLISFYMWSALHFVVTLYFAPDIPLLLKIGLRSAPIFSLLFHVICENKMKLPPVFIGTCSKADKVVLALAFSALGSAAVEVHPVIGLNAWMALLAISECWHVSAFGIVPLKEHLTIMPCTVTAVYASGFAPRETVFGYCMFIIHTNVLAAFSWRSLAQIEFSRPVKLDNDCVAGIGGIMVVASNMMVMVMNYSLLRKPVAMVICVLLYNVGQYCMLRLARFVPQPTLIELLRMERNAMIEVLLRMEEPARMDVLAQMDRLAENFDDSPDN